MSILLFYCFGNIFERYLYQYQTMQQKETIHPESDNLEGKTVENEATNESNPLTDTAAEETPVLSELDTLKLELADQKDKYLRLMAEFENFRRRTAKERIELIQTASKEVIVSFLDVLDDCDRAEKQLNSSEDIALQKEGIQLVFNKVRSTLNAKGVVAMESIHQAFDVDKHEAITEVPVPNEKMKGKIVDEISKGYLLNDKIIRFAKVVVGK
jgi:molecular chaperone GrpE